MHEHTTEPLLDESWYLDLADPQNDLGVWIRLGVLVYSTRMWGRSHYSRGGVVVKNTFEHWRWCYLLSVTSSRFYCSFH